MPVTRFRIVFAVLLSAALASAAGCKKHRPTTTAESRPPVTATGPSSEDMRVVAPRPGSVAGRDVTADVLSEDLATLNKKGYLTDAFFDYDSADLNEQARAALAADAEWLKKQPTARILLEGHCDERGTAAYNLALGERRANAAREYLASLGVAENRLQTVSYGKERPFCATQDESCWQQNRRTHVVVSAK